MSSKHDIRDPWSRIEILTEQCLKLSTSDIPYVPPQIPDMLSWLLSRLSNSYIQEESVFAAHALGRFSDAAKKIYQKELSEEEVYSLTSIPAGRTLKVVGLLVLQRLRLKPLGGYVICGKSKMYCPHTVLVLS